MAAVRLYVELAGFPGSGKSSLAAEVVKLLERQGWSCQVSADVLPTRRGEPLRRLRYASGLLRFGLARPALLLDLLRVLKRGGALERVTRRRCWRLLRLLYAVRRFRQATAASDRHTLVMDQAVYQALWSIYVQLPRDRSAQSRSVPSLGLFERFAAGARDDLPHLVVFLDVDIDTARGRIAGRPGRRGRFDNELFEQSGQVFAATRLLLYGGLPELARRHGSRTLLLDGKRPATDNARLVLDALGRLADGASHD